MELVTAVRMEIIFNIRSAKEKGTFITSSSTYWAVLVDWKCMSRTPARNIVRFAFG